MLMSLLKMCFLLSTVGRHRINLKPRVVNYYYIPCQGGILIFTIIVCMSYVYFNELIHDWWHMCVVCVWMCLAWEVGVCFVLHFLLEIFLPIDTPSFVVMDVINLIYKRFPFYFWTKFKKRVPNLPLHGLSWNFTCRKPNVRGQMVNFSYPSSLSLDILTVYTWKNRQHCLKYHSDCSWYFRRDGYYGNGM